MDTRRDQAEAPTEIPCPPPADARTRSRLPREERRGEILNAALAVFAELGYAQATLNDVAERVGVTKGCLYHHFESKEQLLVELIRERIGRSLLANEQLLASVGGSGQKALAALLEQMWEHFQQPGQIDVAILAINELPKVPEGGVFSSRRSYREAGRRCGARCSRRPKVTR